MPYGEEIHAWDEALAEWRYDIISYAKFRIGVNPTRQQQRLFLAIQKPGSKVSIRAGHSVGKSTAAAIILLWALECIEFSRVGCTAPTAHQLRDVLWAEVSKMIRKSDETSRARGLPRAFWLSELLHVTQSRVSVVGYDLSWFATGQTARKEAPEAFQGIHASDPVVSENENKIESIGAGSELIFIIDEASGVPDEVFQVAEGALASPNSRLLMCANPTKPQGYFFDSHHKNRGHFTTLHFPCSHSPLPPPGYRKRMVSMWGEGSNIVRVRCDGEFPIVSDNALIALEWIEAAEQREAPAPNVARIFLGVDVARFGSDRTVFVRRQGTHVQDIQVMAKLDVMEVTGRVMYYCQCNQIDSIFVDAVGIGAGVADRLRELNMPVTDVQSAENAPERRKDSDSVEMYAKKIRDHIYLEMARWFRDEKPSLDGCDPLQCEMLAGEASSILYKFDSSGYVRLETKDEFKKRLGGEEGRSPDIADALALTFAPDEGSVWLRL